MLFEKGILMAKVYGLAQITVHDAERYSQYEEKFMSILGDHGGRLIGFAEPPEVIEGTFDATRAVLLEFDSREVFDAWYQSDAYQDIVKHRHAASEGSVILINGFG